MEGVLGGQRIKVTKSNGSVYEAVVHTIDTVSRLLVLRMSSFFFTWKSF